VRAHVVSTSVPFVEQTLRGGSDFCHSPKRAAFLLWNWSY
jgi:hypothetical protein